MWCVTVEKSKCDKKQKATCLLTGLLEVKLPFEGNEWNNYQVFVSRR